jgi:hypothetical protein
MQKAGASKQWCVNHGYWYHWSDYKSLRLSAIEDSFKVVAQSHQDGMSPYHDLDMAGWMNVHADLSLLVIWLLILEGIALPLQQGPNNPLRYCRNPLDWWYPYPLSLLSSDLFVNYIKAEALAVPSRGHSVAGSPMMSGPPRTSVPFSVLFLTLHPA